MPHAARSLSSGVQPRLAALLLTLAAAGAAWASPPTPLPGLASCDAGFQTVLRAEPDGSAPAEARAVWLNRQLLRWPGVAAEPGARWRLVASARGGLRVAVGQPVQGAEASLPLAPHTAPLAPALAERFRWVGTGPVLALRPADVARIAELHRGQLLLVQEDRRGRVLQATRVQHAAALDDLYAAAERVPDLGATPTPAGTPPRRAATGFKLWAPTAKAVWLCLYPNGRAGASTLLPMVREAATGVWGKRVGRDLSGGTYTYLVDVFVPGTGLVRNRVTDPYALSLSADSRRTWIGRLDSPAVTPEGWAGQPQPQRVQHATDMVIYELHVRDFSIGDSSVPAPHRGTYMAFTHAGSAGMRHLQAMARAGLTDVHLLPVFDLATVPEQGCTTVDRAVLAALPPASAEQQARVMAQARGDCFNWGYDPLHFTAPEGSFATDAHDGAVRLLEFRRMVQALHAAGLRVGMDVVYNHTSASGQRETSVLDRIVPGYYQRYNAQGGVETSTCCDNTATENRMMAKLMIDSAVVWARDHRVDGFRFDLMGHQPREAMERLQRAVAAAVAPQGRRVDIIGEGWNFGEIANGSRFVQASQLSLSGTGIGTFSDRARDAARGGGCCDNGQQTVQRQGWLNGLHHDPNGAVPPGPTTRDELLRAADLVRVGLAGTLRSYRMTTADGRQRSLAEIDYAGQPAGYASQPAEVVNYVENHDNQTLWDIHALKLPRATPAAERARVQVLGMALTAFSQGIAYYHAGIEILRSKSGDRNSYDSGDWFNRLDWTYTDNGWGAGLPPRQDNADFWPLLEPLLADPALKAAPADIDFARRAHLDLLAIRASSTAFRLRTADDVQRRLTLHNTGPAQLPTLMLGHLDARGLPGGGFAELLYAVNAGREPASVALPALAGRAFRLHPVHTAAGAADPRPATQAQWDAMGGRITVPPRTALVYVLD